MSKAYSCIGDAKILRRFIKKIEKGVPDNCWNWKAGVSSNGRYGSFWITPIMEQAHRAAWRIWRGPIRKNKCVCHKCDNPKCCNPDHLFLGSQTENIMDMDRKNRRVHPRGERVNTAKLTSEKVLEIINSNKSSLELSEKYGVSRIHITRLKRKEQWKHIL